MRVRVGTRSDLACMIAEEHREPFLYCWTQLHSADGFHGEQARLPVSAEPPQQRHSKAAVSLESTHHHSAGAAMLSPGHPRTHLKDKWERTKNGKTRRDGREQERDRRDPAPLVLGRGETAQGTCRQSQQGPAQPVPRLEASRRAKEGRRCREGGEGRPKRFRSFEVQRHTDTALSTTVTCLLAFSC